MGFGLTPAFALLLRKSLQVTAVPNIKKVLKLPVSRAGTGFNYTLDKIDIIHPFTPSTKD